MARAFRFLGGLVLAVVIGILAAVAFSAVMRVQDRPLPAVTGPSIVGRTEMVLIRR